MQSDPSTSKHNFAQARFHVPTWCTHCKLFVRNPFGMQGYHCDKCHAQIHKDCLAAASGTPCGEQKFAPPMTPKKMNATFAQVTQKLVTLKVTDATCTLQLPSWKRLQELMSDLGALATQSHVTKAALSKTLPKYTVGQPELVEDHWWQLIADADGTASLRDASAVLLLLSDAKPDQKLEYLFSLFDPNVDGAMTHAEFQALCTFIEQRDDAWLSDDPEYRGMAIASIRAVQACLVQEDADKVALAAWKHDAAKYRTLSALLERLRQPAPGDVLGQVAQRWRLPSFETWVAERAPPPLYPDEWDATLTTGSVVLAAGGEAVSKLIMKATWSTWSHAALIVRDPPADVCSMFMVDPAQRFFVFESDTITYDDRTGGGVQLVPLTKWLETEMAYCNGEDGRAVVRTLKLPGVSAANEWSEMPGLRNYMFEMIGRGYKWNGELMNVAARRNTSENLSSVFCSELVAAGLVRAGLLERGKLSNNYLPKDFESSAPAPLALLRGAALSNEVRLYRNRPAAASK